MTDEKRQPRYTRADVQRVHSRTQISQYGPEHIGRSQPKPVRLVHQRCRLKVRCDGTQDLEPLRRQMGICLHCARYMSATKPASQSIASWLDEQQMVRGKR